MGEYEVITPKERDRLLNGGISRSTSPRTKALLDGNILFVTGPNLDSLRRTLISLAKHHGKSARTRKATRDGVDGVVVWWEDRAAS